ncbi:MAG: HAMP domain-containing sensor histidine kinase [Rhodococcus sp. (in: high G+C Gram-positive bacteria)]
MHLIAGLAHPRQWSTRTRVSLGIAFAVLAAAALLAVVVTQATATFTQSEYTESLRAQVAAQSTGTSAGDVGSIVGCPEDVIVSIDPPLLPDNPSSTSYDVACGEPADSAFTLDVPDVRALTAAATTSTLRIMTFLTPVILLFALLLGRFVVRWAFAPVREITTRFREISVDKLDLRVDAHGARDEIRDLATVLNSALGRLEDSVAAQRRFVEDASHEIRTPLAGITSSLEVALLYPDARPWSESATAALAEAARLNRLTADLLALGTERTDRGDTTDLLTAVNDAVASPHIDRRIAVDVQLDGSIGTPRVPLGMDRLRRVLDNVIANAVRHAEDDVRVTISSPSAGSESVSVTVEDDGPGIPLDMREKVFERFVRLDRSRDRATGGSGLGLAIVRTLLTGVGGSVSVDSQSSLGGASVTMVLPVMAVSEN